MSLPVRDERRYIPIDLQAGYASNSVSQQARTLPGVDYEFKRSGSSSVRRSQPEMLSAMWGIRDRASTDDWDGEGARSITESTINSAIQFICALPEGLPPPAIEPEPTGEISFEWYKDNRHVCVLTVQDGVVRWSALIGTGAPLYGREFFARSIPGAALIAIREVTA